MPAPIKRVVEKKPKLSKEELDKMREEDNKMVKGIFRCFDPMGGCMIFSFKKYAHDPVRKYEMNDGHMYTVPRMVAKHLNQNCKYPVHDHMVDENGRQIPHIGKWQKRCSFESLEFAEITA